MKQGRRERGREGGREGRDEKGWKNLEKNKHLYERKLNKLPPDHNSV